MNDAKAGDATESCREGFLDMEGGDALSELLFFMGRRIEWRPQARNPSGPMPSAGGIKWFAPEIFSAHGSLLQWIDDYYANADTQFSWTMGKLENSLRGLTAKMIPPDILPRITLKTFGTGTLKNCGPQKHGNFTVVKFWDPDFRQTDWTPDIYSPKPCN